VLTQLSIKNYALIKEAQLHFDAGFTVITGETGAGKSILLGALGLVTGKRADSSSARDASQKCIVEGTFNIVAFDLELFFQENDLDYEQITIVRREILPSGKSRAFVNDTPVSLQQLSSLGDQIVDIHSQHKTLEVAREDFQIEVLDVLADNAKTLEKYSDTYSSLKDLEKELRQLRERQAAAQKEQDYNAFLLSEFEALQLKPDEFENLEESLNTLSNAEFITESLSEVFQGFSTDDAGLLDQIAHFKTKTTKISSYAPKYQELSERLTSLHIEAQDIAQEVEDLSGDLQNDPEELRRVSERYEQISLMLKKHNTTTTSELLSVWESLDNEALSNSQVEAQIEKTESAHAFAKASLDKLAAQLTKKRQGIAATMVTKTEAILKQLGLEQARLEVEILESENATALGKDKVQYLFSANPGMSPQPLKKGASGGELSRVMLAIKAVISDKKQLATLIFDEIDTGVSGAVAQKMGGILKQMGTTLQIVSITHLPQIAGQGDRHFRVNKTVVEGETQTYITKLSPEKRVEELAAMLGSDTVSASALEHAKSLLN